MDIPVGSLHGVIMLFVASGVGIGGKIIFDYFRLTRTGGNKNGNPGGINKTLDVMENKIARLDNCLIQEKVKIARMANDIEGHEKRLDKGLKNFDAIKSDISTIKQNVAVLLDRSNKRRKTEGVSNES